MMHPSFCGPPLALSFPLAAAIGAALACSRTFPSPCPPRNPRKPAASASLASLHRCAHADRRQQQATRLETVESVCNYVGHLYLQV